MTKTISERIARLRGECRHEWEYSPVFLGRGTGWHCLLCPAKGSRFYNLVPKAFHKPYEHDIALAFEALEWFCKEHNFRYEIHGSKDGILVGIRNVDSQMLGTAASQATAKAICLAIIEAMEGEG